MLSSCLLRSRRAFSQFARAEQIFKQDKNSSNPLLNEASPVPIFSQSTIRQVLANQQPREATVCGWIRTKRKSKRMVFLEVFDGSTNKGIQCVLDLEKEKSDQRGFISSLGTGTCVQINGHLVPSPQGKEQPMELEMKEIKVLGECDSSKYPLQKKRHGLDYMRNHLGHLRARSRLFNAVVNVRNETTMAVHDFFQSHEFKHVHTPVLTSHDCEGGGEVFQVIQQLPTQLNHQKNEHEKDLQTALRFFNRPAYLTVSAQLHLEMAVHSHSRVYTLSPCFRADMGSEESTRHLAEFYMLEAEWAWLSNVTELCNVSEQLIRHVLRRVLSKCDDELQYLEHEVPSVLELKKGDATSESATPLRERLYQLFQEPFERLSYTDAFQILQKAQSKHKGRLFQHRLSEWGQPLQTEHERFLCEHVGRGVRGVFVTDYPAACKAFYMKSNQDDLNSTKQQHDYTSPSIENKSTVACMDLLMPRLGEIIGGSLRESNPTRLSQRLHALAHRQYPHDNNNTDHEQQVQKFLQHHQWYVDLSRYGSCPHGGFGLGFDRLLMLLTGLENIRDVVQAGRWKSRLDF